MWGDHRRSRTVIQGRDARQCIEAVGIDDERPPPSAGHCGHEAGGYGSEARAQHHHVVTVCRRQHRRGVVDPEPIAGPYAGRHHPGATGSVNLLHAARTDDRGGTCSSRLGAGRRQQCSPGDAGRTTDDHHRSHRPLVSVAGPARVDEVRLFEDAQFGLLTRQADVDDRNRAAVLRTHTEDVARLEGMERDRSGRGEDRAARLACRRVEARRQVDGKHRGVGFGPRHDTIREAAPEADPEEGIDDEVDRFLLFEVPHLNSGTRGRNGGCPGG